MIKVAIRAFLRCAVIAGCALSAQGAELGTKEMDKLLALYKDYGLPLPPNEAKLVRMGSCVGFWLNPGADKERAEILVGPVHYRIESDRLEDVPQIAAPETVSLDRFETEWRDPYGKFGLLNAGLATMLQCHARGYRNLARRLSKFTGKTRGGGGPDVVSSGGPWMNPRQNKTHFDGASDQTPEVDLAGLAWDYWEVMLIEEKSDWPSIIARLKRILDGQPALQNEPRRDLIRSAEEALKPTTSKPGSVEALIDDLVNVRNGIGGGSGSGGSSRFMPSWQGDEQVRKIEALGFEAVPALIEHCEDRRLTHSSTAAFNNFPALHRRVGEVVCDILQRLAGNDLGADWIVRQVGNTPPRQAVQQWWDGARKNGEETYALAHVLTRESGKDRVNATWLRAVERKFPARLPELYDAALSGNGQFDEIAEAISRMATSKEEKMQVLLRGLRNSDRDHQYWALREIQKIDPAFATEALIKQLEELPEKSAKPIWTSPEPKVAHLVMASDSPEVWQALLRAARRADVSLRMELMKPMDYIYIRDQQRKQRLEFLRAFLDDETVRDLKSDPELYQGPCAGFEFPMVAVGDFAATVIAGILKIHEEPRSEWTSKEWADYRSRVAKALEKEQ